MKNNLFINIIIFVIVVVFVYSLFAEFKLPSQSFREAMQQQQVVDDVRK